MAELQSFDMGNDEVETEVEAPHRRIVPFVIGGVLLLALLAGGAFMAGRMLTGNALQSSGSGGNGGNFVVSQGGPGGGAARQVSLKIEPAAELPTTQADVQGLFQSRSDNSMMIGTGNIEMMMTMGEDGKAESSANFDGPIVEVVVTGDTIIYEDTTEHLLGGPGELPPSENGEVVIQQIVTLVDSLEDIVKDAEVTVWGVRSGDRVIAHTLVYRNFGS
jgi:hypothetical protein